MAQQPEKHRSHSTCSRKWGRSSHYPGLQGWRVKCSSMSHVWLFATAWTVARQVPLSMEFSKQEYWSGFPGLPPGDLPDPGVELEFPALAGRFFTIWATREAPKRWWWWWFSCLAVSNSLQPHGLQPARPLCACGILQARILEWVANPGLKPGLRHCR